ncbi:ATP-binding protein [Ruegeria sediminis]|uniref:ATP-binding protein n=1 Tax=Ruegeria sediminis TaxID=2583820 RepID=UPI001C558565|nr:ATP-binding protein [Ruegeria sediminis]
MKERNETFAQRERRHKRNVSLIYGAILLLGLVSAALMDRTILAQNLVTQRASVQRSLNFVKFRIEQRLEAYSHMSSNLAAALSFEAPTDKAKFQTLARLLRDNNPSVINLARARNFVVTDVHPIEANQAVLGHDYRKNPGQMHTVQKALDSDGTVVIGPIDLIQGGLGLLLRTAQPGPEKIVDTIVLDFHVFLEEAGMTSNSNAFVASARLKSATDADGQVVFGSDTVWDADPAVATVRLGDRDIEIAMIPARGWRSDPLHRPILGLITVILISVAFFGVNYARRLIIERADAKRRLLNAIESIDDGFVIFDKDDRLVMCNEKYRKVFEASRDFIVPGVSFETIIREGIKQGQYPEAEGREEEWIAERLRLHADPHGQTEMLMPDGSWIKVAESKTEDGSTVGIRTDITELKTAVQTAENAIRAKTDFVNNMSHELRTPLSVVLGYVAFLKKVEIYPQCASLKAAIGNREDLQQQLDEFVNVIVQQASKSEKSGKHLLNLINSVLDWAKLSSDNVVLKREPVDLGELLDGLSDEFKSHAAEKGILFDVEVDPVMIQADGLRLKQVFMNIIGNAIKFTDQGYVKVSVDVDDNDVTILVEDSGKGIPDNQLNSIFERFIQVDSSTRREHRGTGLGLAIAKNLVEMHGGGISVTSRLGEGSLFRVVLPRSRSVSVSLDMKMAS